MEANYGNLDQVIGDVFFNLKEIPLKTKVNKTFTFNEVRNRNKFENSKVQGSLKYTFRI